MKKMYDHFHQLSSCVLLNAPSSLVCCSGSCILSPKSELWFDIFDLIFGQHQFICGSEKFTNVCVWWNSNQSYRIRRLPSETYIRSPIRLHPGKPQWHNLSVGRNTCSENHGLELYIPFNSVCLVGRLLPPLFAQSRTHMYLPVVHGFHICYLQKPSSMQRAYCLEETDSSEHVQSVLSELQVPLILPMA